MKSKSILLLLLTSFSLALSGCRADSTRPSGGGGSGGHSQHTDSDVDPEDEQSLIQSISLDRSELEVLVGQKSDSLIVNYNPTGLPLEEREVIWSSSDISVASVDEYGRVTGHKVGDIVITCTTVKGHRTARCLVYVVNSHSDVTKTWKKVNSRSELHDKDIVVIASPERNVTATSENTGMYLHPVESIFSSDKTTITSLGSGTEEFMLGKDDNAPYEEALTMESMDGRYLVCTNEKKVTFVNNKGNKYWMFTFESDGLYVESTSNIYGQLMYDERKGGFSLYDSSPQVDMFLISLYKLTLVRN